jgi:hypothetical protein
MRFLGGLVGALVVVVILFIMMSLLFRGSMETPYPCDDLIIVTETDTIESIAARCGVDVATIYDLNPGLLQEGVALEPGMVLRLTAEEGQTVGFAEQTMTAQAVVLMVTPFPATAEGGGAVDVPIGFTPQPAVTIVQPLPTVVLQQPSPTPFVVQPQATWTPIVNQPLPTLTPIVGQPLVTLTPIFAPMTWTPLPVVPQGTPIAQVPTSTPIVLPTVFPTPIPQQPVPNGQVQVIDPRARVKPYCNDATLPRPVSTPADDNTLRVAYETLFSVDADEVQDGYNALYLSDLRVDSATIQGDVATVQLSGELRVLETGDVCAATRIYNQLTQTALVFPNINTVVITINGQPINDALEIL